MKKKKKKILGRALNHKSKVKIKLKNKSRIKSRAKTKIKSRAKTKIRAKFKTSSKPNFKSSPKRKSKIRSKKKKFNKKIFKKVKKKIIKKNYTKTLRRKKFKTDSATKKLILQIIRLQDKFKFNLSLNIDQRIQFFFQSIAKKIDIFKAVVAEERTRRRQLSIKKMEQEKIESIKKRKLEKETTKQNKIKEIKEEEKFERERKKDLQKFIRLEQAEVRKELAQSQKKFLEQIRLEKRIEQFRKREDAEIKKLEKFVLSQERDSYTEVQERIEKIKQKYQALRDQKIRERVEQLGIEVTDGEDRSTLLEKERLYNIERQKIELTLESFYRSAHSLCFQINKRYIPKYLSILRVIDRRFETGEIFIKWDEAPDQDWLILIYIKDNSPEKGIVIEDKTNSEKYSSHEFKTNEIFKASDLMVDSLTNLLDRERKKRKTD
jgi:hypothetical protein